LHHLNVFASNTGGTWDRTVGQDAVLLEIDDGSTSNTDGSSALDSRGTGESDSAEVGELDEASVLLEIFNNPLGVVLAERAVNTAGEGVADGLALGEVLHGGCAGGLGCCGDGYLDAVTGGDGDAAEVVCVVWVPLVPGVVGDGRTGAGPVNTGLENSSAAGVTVDSNPCGAGSSSTGGWCGEGTSDTGESSANENGTGPVGGVRDVGLVGLLGGGTVNSDQGVAVVVLGTLLSTLAAHGCAWGGDSRASEEGSGGNSCELHFD
jgi:hypothetical protein